MSASYSTGSSSTLCSRPGTSVGRRVTYHAPASRMSEASTAPTMLFVTTSPTMSKSGSA